MNVSRVNLPTRPVRLPAREGETTEAASAFALLLAPAVDDADTQGRDALSTAQRPVAGLPTSPGVASTVTTAPVPDLRTTAAAHDHEGHPVSPTTKKPDGPARPRTTKITKRDRKILALLGRARWATGPQIAIAFSMHESNVRRRLGALRKLGLCDSVATGPSRFLLYRATESGLAIANLDLPAAPAEPSWATIKHVLGLTDLIIAFEAAGESVVTEAEIRAADMRDSFSDRMRHVRGGAASAEPLFAIRAPGSGNRLHIPDLVLARPFLAGVPDAPQSIAIELELTMKGSSKQSGSRLRHTVAAYGRSRSIGATYWYTPSAKIRDTIDRAAVDTNTVDVHTIRKFEPSAASWLGN